MMNGQVQRLMKFKQDLYEHISFWLHIKRKEGDNN
jgi:hypothetical protein